MSLGIAFANGTTHYLGLSATSATMMTIHDGSVGDFEGTGAGWMGAYDLSSYTVTVDSPSNGVTESLKLESVCEGYLFHAEGK